jgi:hypothetical protein
LSGYEGAENEMTVLFEEETEEFEVYFNGFLGRRFRDEEEPVHRGGKNGYAVVITPYDRFPEEEVGVYFKEER